MFLLLELLLNTNWRQPKDQNYDVERILRKICGGSEGPSNSGLNRSVNLLAYSFDVLSEVLNSALSNEISGNSSISALT